MSGNGVYSGQLACHKYLNKWPLFLYHLCGLVCLSSALPQSLHPLGFCKSYLLFKKWAILTFYIWTCPFPGELGWNQTNNNYHYNPSRLHTSLAIATEPDPIAKKHTKPSFRTGSVYFYLEGLKWYFFKWTYILHWLKCSFDFCSMDECQLTEHSQKCLL